MDKLPDLRTLLVKDAPTEVVVDKVGPEFEDNWKNKKHAIDFTVRATGQKGTAFVKGDYKNMWLVNTPATTVVVAKLRSFQINGDWKETVDFAPSGDIQNAPQNVEGVKASANDRSAEIGFRGILQACLIAFGDEAWDKAEEYDQRIRDKFAN